MANVTSIIDMHNEEVITEKKTKTVNCYCINKPEWPLPKQWHNTKEKLHQIFETIQEKYTTEPTNVHLHNDTETITNHSITKNIGQIQNFRRNTVLYFKKIPINKKNRYLLFMIERKTVYHWTPRKGPFKPKKLFYL